MAHIPSTQEYTVSELSAVLKRTVEDAFPFVRVRGEISGLKKAPSGHAYFSLKDSDAVIASICWKGTFQRLPFQPEDGVEVICVGRITTYPGRSQYQLTVEAMEPAGIGALMALLEKRKQQLAAEGLFDPSRKKPLPYLPDVIGVVTSPTGAVIRDILHRLEERFPRHVLLWPVLVQGENAAAQITAAINGFNRLPQGDIPRPDVLIVARGGGSLEDLWPFNEENVVRAVAASDIPVISAVGHETDTTLIDYAADVRAPTPTAAAEMAVPVRADLIYALTETGNRLWRTVTRHLDHKQQVVDGLARGLPKPVQVLSYATQRLDMAAERLGIITHSLTRYGERLTLLEKLLESYHYKKVLARGFALVRGENNQLVTSAKTAKQGGGITLEFHDGTVSAAVIGGKPGKKQKLVKPEQGALF